MWDLETGGKNDHDIFVVARDKEPKKFQSCCL